MIQIPQQLADVQAVGMQGATQPISATPAAYSGTAGMTGQSSGQVNPAAAAPSPYSYQLTPQMVQSSSASNVGYSQAAVAYANQAAAAAASHPSYQTESHRYPGHYGKK